MIKTIKVESILKTARNWYELSKNENISIETRNHYRIRAEAIRCLLASEDTNRKYKYGTGKDKEWSKYFEEAWNEYNDMIF